MSIESVRVVRGPDWSYGNQDGGEGHVGTITQDNEDETVEVQWDMGESGTYNTGKDGIFDLRILDSAPAGLKHFNVVCDGCEANEFPGTRWKCSRCEDFDLCNLCYFKDLHNLQHPFLRIDVPGRSGVDVPKRSNSVSVTALGITTGANVTRGVDWNAGDQDGGRGNIGTVVKVINYGQGGHERDAVTVKWPNSKENSYRVGYRGKVDLRCLSETCWINYYKEHLLILDTRSLRRSASVKPPISKRFSVLRGNRPQIGDKVCIFVQENALKEAQKGHGDCSMRMLEYIGEPGELKRFEDNGDCIINYDGMEYRLNINVVKKIPTLQRGETIRILDNIEQVIALQKRHGGWQSEMKDILGKVGKIVKIDSDGDVAVSFGRKAWVVNPACCVPAPNEVTEDPINDVCSSSDFCDDDENKVNDNDDDDDKATDENSASSSSSDNDDTQSRDNENDEQYEELGNLIAQICYMQLFDSESQSLIDAAATDSNSTVQKILKENPALVNEEQDGVTALIVAAHEGYADIVKTLLKFHANTDLTDNGGNTALMAALMKGHEEIAKLLLKAGATLDICNKHNKCALHFAASNKLNNIVKELLKRGANPNLQDSAGNTPLHEAITNANDAGAALFVSDKRINFKLGNKKGFPPLHWAVFHDSVSTVEKILNRTPEDINLAIEEIDTPLHIAAVNNYTSVAKLLLKRNADIDPVTDDWNTPLHYAAQQSHITTSMMLIESFADINAQNIDGDTPLHCCVLSRRSSGMDQTEVEQLMELPVADEAELKDRIYLACFMIQQNALTNIRNKRGLTALECCNDDKMENAICMFAAKQKKKSARGRSSKMGPDTLLAELFLDVSLPCMKCMEEISDAKFEPCGHKVCCQRCSFRVRDCPMCDKTITARTDLDGNRLAMKNPCKVQ